METWPQSNAAIQIPIELFTKFTRRYLIDYDSHCKDFISFTECIKGGRRDGGYSIDNTKFDLA